MSYLKFDPGSPVFSRTSATRYIAWPVRAIPVRFWDATSESFDILEEAELRLIALDIRDEKRVQELLGIPPEMSQMVKKTTNRLISGGYVTPRNEITEKGLQALHDQDMWHKRLQYGWVFYDKVREWIFPFVQISRLEYYSKKQYLGMNPYEMGCGDTLPDVRQLKNQTLAAIISYNQRRMLLERDDSVDQYDPLDPDSEFDQPLQAFTDQEIEDFSLDLPEYGEDHFILVQLSAEYIPGRGGDHVTFHSYSPFSHWEQDLYLNFILERAKGDSDLQGVLEQLREKAIEKRHRFDNSEIDVVKFVGNAIKKRLDENKCKLPVDIGDQVWTIETNRFYSVLARSTGNESRDVLLNYGRCIESSLRAIVAEIDPLSISFKSDVGKLKIDWYDEQASKQPNPANWLSLNLPEELRKKIGRQLEGLPDTYRKIKANGGRDLLVKLMLFIVSQSDLRLSKQIENLANAINNESSLLHNLDKTFDWRNKTGHDPAKVSQLSDEEYKKLLDDVENCMYEFLQSVYKIA